jgi:hypothetical protein
MFVDSGGVDTFVEYWGDETFVERGGSELFPDSGGGAGALPLMTSIAMPAAAASSAVSAKPAAAIASPRN